MLHVESRCFQVSDERPGSAQAVRRKRQQRHVSCALNRLRQHALMLGAGAGLTSGTDFSLLRDVSLQQIQALVIDLFDLFSAELALFSASSESTARPR
jgi:hypothetical protein